MNAFPSADDGGEFASHEIACNYWLEQFSLLSATPDLPRVRGSVGLPQFDRIEAVLERPQWKALWSLGQQRGITPPEIVSAVFIEVIRAWSVNEEFIIGLVAEPPDRQRRRLDGPAPASEPTCPRVPLAATKTGKTFTDRAAGICEQISQRLANRRPTGDQAPREAARCQGSRLCGSVPVTLRNLIARPGPHPVNGPEMGADGDPGGSEVLLDVKVHEIGETLHIVWDHRSGAFPHGMVDSMSTAFHTLLLRLSADAGEWDTERFDLRPAAQIQRRTAVNATARAVPECSLSDLLDERAAAQPDAPALIAPDLTLSFRQLTDAANVVAGRLERGGAEPLVAIGMRKGWEQFAALHGIQRRASAYLPLDVEQPDARLRRILANAGVQTVLAQPQTADRFRRLGAKVIVCDGKILTQRAAPPTVERRPRPDDIAYVIFTSGSTGSPKGVAVRHRAVVNHVLDASERFGVGREDRLLATTGLHSDLSVFEIFGTVATGGAVVLPAHTSGPDPEGWLALARERSVTFWATVPALMEMACEAHEQAWSPVLRSLRRVILGGDVIPLTLPRRVTTLAPDARIANVGGPTETTIWSIYYEIDEVDPSWSSIPYGKPMANSAYHIVGPDWTHRPDWVPGEMLVESDVALAAGYWEDPKRTAERFVTDPRTGRRVYRTGDIGRYLPDGNIEILGRTDFQVKIRGYRIELGEIEYQLASISGVERAVAVKALSCSGGLPRLVAFVEASSCDVAAMKNQLRSQLPAYMVPHEIRRVDKLPLTPNGKIDRARLEREAAVSTRPTWKQRTNT